MHSFPRKSIQSGCNKQEAEQDVLFTGKLRAQIPSSQSDKIVLIDND